MEVIRTFHPIGQGGFYTETFDDSKNKSMIVFDCGGNSKKFMKEYMDSFLPSDKKAIIEAVFISHLHNDHINGLEYLLRKANVKKIFLPQFTPNHLFNVFFYNAAYGSGRENCNNFVLSLVQSTKSSNKIIDTLLVQVEEFDGDEGRQDNIPIQNYSNQNGLLKHGLPLTYENTWVYIPFNPKSKKPNFDNLADPTKEALKAIYKEEDICKQAEYLVEFIKGINVSECKKLYKQMFGGIHNSQSMTLFSGMLTLDPTIRRQRFLHSPYCRFWPYRYRCYKQNLTCIDTNFLYTGDYEAADLSKMSELRNFYISMSVWDTICGVQIPHHGSRDNYAADLYENQCYAIASAGASNKYHHPNIDTLINIFHQRCMPFVVTEAKNTIIMQEFNI